MQFPEEPHGGAPAQLSELRVRRRQGGRCLPNPRRVRRSGGGGTRGDASPASWRRGQGERRGWSGASNDHWDGSREAGITVPISQMGH